MTSPVPDASRRAFLETAVRHYEAAIRPAIPYLLERGIGKEIALKYRLGYVPEGCSDEHRGYAGRLCIPYLTRAGVVAVRFRTIDGKGPKYLSTPGDVPRLFNVNALFEGGDTLVVTEGEFDAITVSEHVGVPCVGVPGAALWTPVFTRMVQDHPVKIIVADGDDTGREFAAGLAKELDGRVVQLPAGEDANSVLVKFGPLELRETLGV